MSFIRFHLDRGESRTVTLDGYTYTLGFEDDQVVLQADEPFAGKLFKKLSLYRNEHTIHLDRDGERVSVRIFSRRGNAEKRSKDWRQLASAFYTLAHGDTKLFEALPEHLAQTDVAEVCRIYLESREYKDLDTAGRMLTGSRDWYTYLGR